MGDARNKWRKFERDDQIAAGIAAQRARNAARPPLPTCACGNTWETTQPFVCAPRRWTEAQTFFCTGCCPPQHLWEMALLVCQQDKE